jgi:hypothetical protein
MFCYLDQFPVEILPELVGDNRMTILGRQYEVVIAQVYAMTISPVLTFSHCVFSVAWIYGDYDADTHCIPELTLGVFLCNKTVL